MESWTDFMDVLSRVLQISHFVEKIVNVKHENELMSHLFKQEKIM